MKNENGTVDVDDPDALDDFLSGESGELAPEYKEGALYKRVGDDFVELERDPTVVKVPVTLEAEKAVKNARNLVAKEMGTRPELSIVASAILIQGAKADGLVDTVRKYGAKLYQS